MCFYTLKVDLYRRWLEEKQAFNVIVRSSNVFLQYSLKKRGNTLTKIEMDSCCHFERWVFLRRTHRRFLKFLGGGFVCCVEIKTAVYCWYEVHIHTCS